jgi:hypothetical protein
MGVYGYARVIENPAGDIPDGKFGVVGDVLVQAAIRGAPEAAGVEFIPAKGGQGVGVRLREDQEE